VTSGRRRSSKKKVAAVRPQVGSGRVATVAALAGIILAGFMWRLVDLQLTPDPELASGIGTRTVERPIPAPRGEILDRHGRPMALSLPSPTIIANPRMVPAEKVPEIVAALGSLLSTDPDVLTSRLSGDGYFAYLERQVDPSVGEAVEALNLPGISTIEEPRREHPNGDCSGIDVVGRVDPDHRGSTGLELKYDELLTGSDGKVVLQSSANGRSTIPGGRQVVEPARPGSSLELTIDRNIQFKSENLIEQAVEETGGSLGIVIVTIPSTGEIVAMASARRSDATGLVGCTTTNLGVIWSYEPGSVMKPMTVSSLLENHPDAAGERIEVPYSIVRDDGAGGKTFTDHRFRETEMMSLTDIISRSSNVGAILTGEKVGASDLHGTLVDMGFGSRTALDFKGEASGILNRLDIDALALSNVSMGQGVAVTPLQLITAYNTIANGGIQPAPVLVKDDVGEIPGRRVLTQATAEKVYAMLRQVVIDGTGTAAALPGFDVAGKTGTAWQPCSPGLGYVCEGGGRHYTATFVGMIGDDSGPQLSAIVVVDDPQEELGSYYGGSVAAPVFKKVMAYATGQLRIAPLGDPGSPTERLRSLPASEPILPTPTEANS